MLLIGSTGRNSGKTEFAREVIQDLCRRQRVVGLKVCTIRDERYGCPRGRDGCGVCTRVTGAYLLTDESHTSGTKDTHRLVAAGAEEVYWLRVKEPHLAEGLRAFRSLVDAGVPVVCESNSLRKAVVPGLFAMLRPTERHTVKQSARDVMDLADVHVSADGSSFDPEPHNVRFNAGAFSYRHRATAVVLAGGKSRRMGEEKALLEIDGVPLIRHVIRQLEPWFHEIIVSTGNARRFPFLDVKQVADPVEGVGPLAGILAGLEAATYDRCLVYACDMPEVPTRLVSRLVEAGRAHDAAVPRYPDGTIEPLCALYAKTLVPNIRTAIQAGARRVRAAYDGADVCYLSTPKDDAPKNLNTRHEYQDYASTREASAHAGVRRRDEAAP
jgi:molybdopterin-guanine dinucleotide biosynthesis protein A